MKTIRVRLGRLAASVGAVALVSLVTAAAASASATTLPPTQVTDNSALLEGIGAPISFDAGWMFEYGTTPALGSDTPLYNFGYNGVTAVSATIGNLKPATKYYYRLLVIEDSYSPETSSGSELSFTTLGATAGSAPIGVSINSGAYATSNRAVTLDMSAPAGTTSILVSGDGGFQHDVHNFSPAATIHWTLANTGFNGLPQTVYVRFLGTGMDSTTFADDIVLDAAAPTVSRATLLPVLVSARPSTITAATVTRSAAHVYRLRVLASDTRVAVCSLESSATRSAGTITRLASCSRRGLAHVNRVVSITGAAAPRYVRVRNSAGVWSRWTAVTG